LCAWGVEEHGAEAEVFAAGLAQEAHEVAVVHEVEVALFEFVFGAFDPCGHAAQAVLDGDADFVFSVFPVAAAQMGDFEGVIFFPEAQGGLGDAQQGRDLWDAVGVGAEFDEFLADFGGVHRLPEG
jgi:hypothetical protein